MRLQLLGSYTLEEFQMAISKVFDDFKGKNIDTVRNINIYLQPCSKDRIVYFFEDDEEVEHIIYDFSKHRKISMVSAKLSVSSEKRSTKKGT